MTNATIDTDNLVNDFIANCAGMISENMNDLGLRRIYNDDVTIIDSTPSLAVSCNSVMFETRTVGRRPRITITLVGDLWYYDSLVSEDSSQSRVMASAVKISNVLMKNPNLQGFLTNESIDMKSVTYVQRIRGGIIYCGARILFLAPYLASIVVNR